MDMKSGFLLFSIAKGTPPPEHVGAEPGSEHLLKVFGGGNSDVDKASGGSGQQEHLPQEEAEQVGFCQKGFQLQA